MATEKYKCLTCNTTLEIKSDPEYENGKRKINSNINRLNCALLRLDFPREDDFGKCKIRKV